MSAMGFRVGWSHGEPAFPLIFHSVGDAAFSAPRTDAVMSFVEVVNVILGPTFSAGFPPPIPSFSASSVPSFVSEWINQFKVFDSVVDFVFIPVMHLHSFGDGSVVLFPNNIVLHAEASLFGAPDTSITFGGD